jgi:hypothetical protein
VIVTKKDEKLIKPGDDINIGQEVDADLISQDDRYSIAVVENPLYAEAEHENAVSYHKAGADEDGDEEEVKVHQCLCNRFFCLFDSCKTLIGVHEIHGQN